MRTIIKKWYVATIAVIASALALSGVYAPGVFAIRDDDAEVEDNCDPETMNCIPESWARGAADGARDDQDKTESDDSSAEIEPTFATDVDDSNDSAVLRMGKNFLVAGNNITTTIDAPTGLMFVAGNTLNLRSSAEYGFVAGNNINFAGETKRDLFAAGNMVTLEPNAKIGRNVFAMGAVVSLKTNLSGDFSASAAEVVIKDAEIKGNVNLTADEIRFEGKVKVAGTLTYNDDATVSGLNNNSVEIATTETFHVEKVNPAVKFAAEVYAKLFSVAGLFLATVLILALYNRLHEKIADNVTPEKFGKDLAIGLGMLIGVPVFAIVTLCTVVAAPLGIIALVIYCVMIYLSQGFAGVWLGHLIVVRLCKGKDNVYFEALIGIVILGALSMIPFIGVLTGMVGLLLGLGLITVSLAPRSTLSPSAKNKPTPIAAKSKGKKA